MSTPSDILPGVGTGADETVLPEAPYRGIEPFRFIDQQIFAARTDETWTLLSNVTLYRGVLLYGDSGTGKSSLVNAGLLPQALKENYVADRLRVQPVSGREIKVERIRKSAGGDGANYLPSNFIAAQEDVPTESIELSLDVFRARLEEFRPLKGDPAADGQTLELPAGRPLLIFDQFEEFITLFEEARRAGARETSGRFEKVPEVQKNILGVLVDLIQDQTLPVKIIFAFREDYLAKLCLLFDHCPELLDQAQRLLPPHVDLLPQIIRAPFVDEALRAHFQQTGAARGSEISEPLAQSISNELSLRSEGDRANLTELQIVCQRLWDAPDAEGLFAQGVEGILNSYGDDVLAQFNLELRDAAIVLLSHMITASDTRNIISEDDLLNWALHTMGDGAEQKERLRSALKSLSDSQIVRRERRRNIYFYEITSEYLVPWIKKRVADRKAMIERGLAAKAQADLEAKRDEAEARFEKEQRRLRWAKIVSASLFLLLFLSCGLVIFAGYYYSKAKKSEAAANEAKALTARIVGAVGLINSKNKDEALAGVSQADKLIKENNLSTDLKRSLLAPVLGSSNLEVKQAALKVLIYAAQQDRELVKDVVYATENDQALVQKLSGDAAVNFENLTKSLPPRIYFHIADEGQRPAAQRLATSLTKNGKYLVPGISNVGTKAPMSNQLRFFSRDDPNVKEIMNLLKDAATEDASSGGVVTPSEWKETFISGYDKSDKIRPGHFELWFALPTGTPIGWLRAWPVDELGNYISGLRITYVITDSKGKSIRKYTTYTALSTGDYELTATFPGYEPVKTKFSIESGAETKLKLPVTKSK